RPDQLGRPTSCQRRAEGEAPAPRLIGSAERWTALLNLCTAVLRLLEAERTEPTGTRRSTLEVMRRRGCGRPSPPPHSGSSRFVVNDPAVAGIHAPVLAALVSRIRIR